MSFKFLRQTGEFAFPTPADIGISTSTSTNLLSFFSTGVAPGVNVAITANGATTLVSLAQGSTGVWYVSGSVYYQNAATTQNITAQITDGTNAIATQAQTVAGTNLYTFSGSGIITNPAGNLRLTMAAGSSSGGVAQAYPGNVLSAFRIG